MHRIEYSHLQTEDFKTLDRLGITRKDLPTGISIACDVLGTLNDPLTGKFYPGTEMALRGFRHPLERFGMTFIIATNGPDLEGLDPLRCIAPDHNGVRAFAVTEGGARLVSRAKDNSGWDFITLADQRGITSLGQIAEEAAKRSALMRALLEDKKPTGQEPPIRTPYATNIVCTLPQQHEVLVRKLLAVGVNLSDFIPQATPESYIQHHLEYARSEFSGVIAELGLDSLMAPVLVKPANRRVYVAPGKLFDGSSLSKAGGVTLASTILNSQFPDEYGVYALPNSVYIADNIIQDTSSGQHVGSGESSMVLGSGAFWQKPSIGVRAFNILALNITNDGSPISEVLVDGARVLNVSSSAKAIEVLTYLYRGLHH